MNAEPRPLLVVGAGIAGITAALEAAEAGQEVVLIEREASVGGRVLRNHQYFPKMCPPSCGMEINTRRLQGSTRVRVLVRTQLASAERVGAAWKVKLREAPAYVTDACTACGDCTKVCPAKLDDAFNLGLGQVPAVRMFHVDAWPRRYTMDRAACEPGCHLCVDACKAKAIDLDAQEKVHELEVGAIVFATGWEPYPLEKLGDLGGGRFADVISNVQMERYAAPSGPTGGKILRPSNGEPPKSVAFVQCAGSRDVNHLPYCSGVCCQASLKQVHYVRQQLPDAAITIYYIDRRAPGRNEVLIGKAEAAGAKLVKGKVGRVQQGEGGRLTLRLEDVEAGHLVDAEAELVVLATGMVPVVSELPDAMPRDPDGFALDDRAAHLFVAGVARRPEDVAASVRDATGAAAKALCAARSA